MSKENVKLGAVVEHNESGVRYAVSADNINPKIHKVIRPLKVGETVRGYKPQAKETQAQTVAPVADTPKPTQPAPAGK